MASMIAFHSLALFCSYHVAAYHLNNHGCIQERLRIVSGVLNLDIIGVSMSSAELSKNESTVLSAVRKTTEKISTNTSLV